MNRKIDVKRKKNIRLEDATLAVIAAVQAYSQTNPGAELTKEEIIRRAVGRAPNIIEEHYDPVYEEWAIPDPDEHYFITHWSDIVKKAAKDYGVFIVIVPHVGFRMGTINEWAENNKLLNRIVIGICGSSQDRAAIVFGQGYKGKVAIVGSKTGIVGQLEGIEKFKQLHSGKEEGEV